MLLFLIKILKLRCDRAAFTFNDKGIIRHRPISPITLPIIVLKNCLALFVTTTNAKTTWKNGGFVSVNIFTGLRENYSTEICRKKLSLNQVNLLIFNKYTQSASLTIYVPKWFKDFNYSLWEYVGGGIPDNFSLLSLIYDKLP